MWKLLILWTSFTNSSSNNLKLERLEIIGQYSTQMACENVARTILNETAWLESDLDAVLFRIGADPEYLTAFCIQDKTGKTITLKPKTSLELDEQ